MKKMEFIVAFIRNLNKFAENKQEIGYIAYKKTLSFLSFLLYNKKYNQG